MQGAVDADESPAAVMICIVDEAPIADRLDVRELRLQTIDQAGGGRGAETVEQPAPARMKAPLQTEKRMGRARRLVRHPLQGRGAGARSVHVAAGTTRISGRGASAKVYFGTTVMPIAVVTGSRVSATV